MGGVPVPDFVRESTVGYRPYPPATTRHYYNIDPIAADCVYNPSYETQPNPCPEKPQALNMHMHTGMRRRMTPRRLNAWCRSGRSQGTSLRYSHQTRMMLFRTNFQHTHRPIPQIYTVTGNITSTHQVLRTLLWYNLQHTKGTPLRLCSQNT